MQLTAAHTDYKSLYEDAILKLDALQVKYAALEHEVAQLKKMIFGSRHERFIPAANNPFSLL